MKGLKFVLTNVVIVFFLIMPTDRPAASAVDELVAKAKRESAINVHAPTTLGVSGTRELASIFNKKYGLNIKLNYFPSGGYTKDTARVMSQSAMGVPPEWDLMVLTENFHADLSRRGLLLPYDYKTLGIDPKAIHHKNGSITLSHAIVLPAYNAKILPLKDVPATWEDLLDENGKTVSWGSLIRHSISPCWLRVPGVRKGPRHLSEIWQGSGRFWDGWPSFIPAFNLGRSLLRP